MKRLLLTAIAAGFCVCSYAQTEKGKVILGGSIGFNSSKVDGQAEQKATSFNIGPAIGFFVDKNIVVGLGLEYTTNKNDPYSYTAYFNGLPYTNGTNGSKGESLGIIPFFRYYWDLHERVKLFGQANTGISWGKSTTLNIDGTESENVDDTYFKGSIQSGIAFFPVKRLAIELKVPLFQYHHQKVNYHDPSITSSRYNHFSFGSDLTKPILGVNFHF
ncbi:outer membrane beta-barrel protein [Pedobacter xixiisoli]|uniref:Outer membrane protein beta-barrel domain-containing protein n=1 Tax=Pedobacter xixiisoli TaxID=1476464 RepID=A0A285ZY66_9SPHI|nr:outer membrane beta-barrel protein [Pedobacter xixiisoli]SOD14591.1 Outer membrane protein beta-barrel domain-containing protein [Pedobacter xixiisoli]